MIHDSSIFSHTTGKPRPCKRFQIFMDSACETQIMLSHQCDYIHILVESLILCQQAYLVGAGEIPDVRRA
jgi:hypothetical protein